MMVGFTASMVSAAHEQDREQVYKLCKEIRQITVEKVDVVIADQGYIGENANIDAAVNDVELVVVKRPTSKKGFVLLPLRWVVERSFAWIARFRRLERDLERLESNLGDIAETLTVFFLPPWVVTENTTDYIEIVPLMRNVITDSTFILKSSRVILNVVEVEI